MKGMTKVRLQDATKELSVSAENLLGTVKVDNANQTGTVKMKAKPNKYKILGWENMETIAPVHNPLTGVIE